jgi:hypothetical protein
VKYLEILFFTALYCGVDWLVWAGMHWLFPDYSPLTCAIVMLIASNWSLAEKMFKKQSK